MTLFAFRRAKSHEWTFCDHINICRRARCQAALLPDPGGKGSDKSGCRRVDSTYFRGNTTVEATVPAVRQVIHFGITPGQVF